jgi:glucose/arabinose dehydrogenase
VALAADGRSVAGPALLYFKQDDRYRDTAISPDGRLFVVTDNEGSVLDARWQRIEVLAHPGTLLEFTYTAPQVK